jgi:aminoglycoside phosphotransferase
MQFEKHRDLVIDPFVVQYKRLEIRRIINYPHAANDVIHCLGTIDKKDAEFFIKYERHKDADFGTEAYFLNCLQDSPIKVPKIIECGNHNGINYLALEKIDGARISFLLDSYWKSPKRYCTEFGNSIGMIHKLDIKEPQAAERSFHKPLDNVDGNTYLASINEWLIENKPSRINLCFLHGDHHYANVLFKQRRVSGVLDWELAGYGNKEYDLAWSIALRPSQKFFNTKWEEDEILNGYGMTNTFDYGSYQYYKVQIISHYYSFTEDDPEYQIWIRNEVLNITGLS